MKKQLILTACAAFLFCGTADAQIGKLLKKKEEKKETTEKPVEASSNTAESQPPATANPATADTTIDDNVYEDVMNSNQKLWLQEFPGGIDWFSLTSGGTLIVSANKALSGIDGTTGKVLWTNPKFGGIDKDNFAAIAGSPYVAIVSGGMFNRQQTIINTLDGSIVADTRNFGVKHVSKRYPVPNQNGFMLSAMSDGKPTVFMIDNNESKVAWKIDQAFEKTNEILVTRPFNINESQFFLATDKRIYKMNSKTGAIESKVDFKTPNETLVIERPEDEGMTESTKDGEQKTTLEKTTNVSKKLGLNRLPGPLGKVAKVANTVQKVDEAKETFNMKGESNLASTQVNGKFFRMDASDVIYYFNNKYFVGIDSKTGQLLYEPFKFDDDVATFIPHKDGAIFATDEKKSELYYLDYKTGKNKWAKSPTLRGRINNISLNEGKIAVSSAKNKGTNYVNIIDINTGAEVNKKDMKVSGTVTNVYMVKRGLIYSTNEETNIQDPETGKDVIKKSLKYKSGGSSVRKDGKFYVINDNEIDVIDETTGDVNVFAKLDFNDREKPEQIELRNSGILVTSSQNMVLLDFGGKEKYHKFLRAPDVSTAGKILGGVAATVGTTMSMANAAASGMARGANNGFATMESRQYDRAADAWGNLAMKGFAQFSKRFNMTVGSADYQIILAEIKGNPGKGFTLVKVDKETGNEMGSVVIGDKKPDYIFDPYNNLIYYRNRGKKISGFKL